MSPVQVRGPARRMSTRDAGFLYLERPGALLHIGCVAVVDGPLEADELAQRVASRLPRMRRYGQRAVPVPGSLGHPTWEDDPDFDVRNHIRRWSLPAPGGMGELVETLTALLQLPLDRSRPLWEMHLIEGLDGGRSAVLQKVHHCMIDGVAGAQLLEVLLDERPAAGFAHTAMSPAPPLPGAGLRLGSALLDGARRGTASVAGRLRALAGPVAARSTVERLRAAAWTAVRLAGRDVIPMPWNGPVGPRRTLAFTRLPMDGVRRIRRVRGGTVNDVVLCAIAGGLRRYLVASGVRTRGLELVALVPVSLRSAEEVGALGNRISGMLVPLAVDPVEEVPRLVATRAITRQLKDTSAWAGMDALLAALDDVPPPLLALLGRSLRIRGLANLVVTNVPGPRETRYLGRARVEALYPIVPLAGDLSLGVAVFSYDGVLHVGTLADAALLPDVEKLQAGIEDAFQALLAAS